MQGQSRHKGWVSWSDVERDRDPGNQYRRLKAEIAEVSKEISRARKAKRVSEVERLERQLDKLVRRANRIGAGGVRRQSGLGRGRVRFIPRRSADR